MITIRNTQKNVPINAKAMRNDIARVLQALGYADFDIGVWITTDRSIRAYNKCYRNKDKATNILSFPYHTCTPDQRIAAQTLDEHNLGDLIISAACVQREARELGRSTNEHLRVLLVHGICHLIGHTHDKDTDYQHMQAQEDALLSLLSRGPSSVRPE